MCFSWLKRGCGQSGAYGVGTLLVGVEVGRQNVGEKEQLQNQKEQHQFGNNQYPQLPADGHGSETVDIHGYRFADETGHFLWYYLR